MFFKKKEQVKVKVNVGKAIAKVSMKSGIERYITTTGYASGITGIKILEYYLDAKHTLLKDDEGKFFPVSDIREITVFTEDYFI